jgi:hypothetical protein
MTKSSDSKSLGTCASHWGVGGGWFCAPWLLIAAAAAFEFFSFLTSVLLCSLMLPVHLFSECVVVPVLSPFQHPLTQALLTLDSRLAIVLLV